MPLGASYLPVPGEEYADVRVARSWGSCGIDYPKLVEGEVDFLCYRSMFPWDHLAGGLMVTELGGRIATDISVDYRAGVIGRRDAMPRCVDTRSPSVSPGPSAKRIATS